MGQSKWAILFALTLIVIGAEYSLGEESASRAATPTEAEERIERALDQRLKSPLEFIETPLNTVMQALSEEYNLPILFDTAALEAVAQSPETEVTVTVRNVSLRSALDLMLRNVDDVTYLIDNEVLLITTEDEAATRLEVRVYRVDDLRVAEPLFDTSSMGGSTAEDVDSLVDLITSTVDVESWTENGTGEGEIQPFEPGMLVVSQTRRVHQQIEQLFATLRKTKAAVLADAATNDDDAFITRGIRLYDDSLAKDGAEREAIRDALIASVDWEAAGADAAEEPMLRVLPTRLIVRHRPRVVYQVMQTLRELSVATRSHQVVFAGGGVGGNSATGGAENPADGRDNGRNSGSRRQRGGF